MLEHLRHFVIGLAFLIYGNIDSCLPLRTDLIPALYVRKAGKGIASPSQHYLPPATLHAQIEPLIDGQVVVRVPEGNVPLDLYVRLAEAAAQRALAGLHLPPRLPYQLWRSGNRTRASSFRPVVGGDGGVRSYDWHPAVTVRRIADSWYPAAGNPAGAYRRHSGIGAQWRGPNGTGMVGFLTLIGIGLSHSHGIVLLDRVRHNENTGMPLEQAIREAIQVSFRPIVLTAVTAILGMLPTALRLGEGAGLAVVRSWGARLEHVAQHQFDSSAVPTLAP